MTRIGTLPLDIHTTIVGYLNLTDSISLFRASNFFLVHLSLHPARRQARYFISRAISGSLLSKTHEVFVLCLVPQIKISQSSNSQSYATLPVKPTDWNSIGLKKNQRTESPRKSQTALIHSPLRMFLAFRWSLSGKAQTGKSDVGISRRKNVLARLTTPLFLGALRLSLGPTLTRVE